MLTIPQTIDVLCAAWAINNNITAPSEVVRFGPLWIVRDANAKPGKARAEEIIAWGVSPTDTMRAVKDYAPPDKYLLEPLIKLDDDIDAINGEYKSLGYKAMSTETLFVCPLRDRKAIPSKWAIHRVANMDEMRRVTTEVLGRARRKLRPQDLTDVRPVMRMYYAQVDGRAVAVARSLMPRRGVSWMHGVHTVEAYRRQGIATALINQVLADDAVLGSKHSALLATPAGAKLYPLLGFQSRAVLQLYAPTR
jgi:GNAT superfamily N-acetyltransferase